MGCAVITLFAPYKRIVDPPIRLPAIAFAANFYEVPQAADRPATRHAGASLIDDANLIAVVERPDDHAVRLGSHIRRRVVVADDTSRRRAGISNERVSRMRAGEERGSGQSQVNETFHLLQVPLFG
jgi:hypothetical protein